MESASGQHNIHVTRQPPSQMFMIATLQVLSHLPFRVNISVRVTFRGQLSKFCQINPETCYVMLCGRVPAANAPGCTAAEGLLYKPWSLVVPTFTARCLHQRPQ